MSYILLVKEIKNMFYDHGGQYKQHEQKEEKKTYRNGFDLNTWMYEQDRDTKEKEDKERKEKPFRNGFDLNDWAR